MSQAVWTASLPIAPAAWIGSMKFRLTPQTPVTKNFIPASNQVTVMPVILGSGIRLVDALPAPQFLMQEQAAPGSGSTEIIYQLDA